VWLWHNGEDVETLRVVNELREHPRVARFHHSPQNVKLRTPTNWLWTQSRALLLSKVDDDCLLPDGWLDTLVSAHCEERTLGVIGCWRFFEEDFQPHLAEKKIAGFGRHRIMKNLWVEGSGYLMKRQCLQRRGLLEERQSFTDYCIRLAADGWVNGWYYPFIFQEHMDDPRSPNSLLKSDEDLQRYLPLSAKNNGARTLQQWQAQLKRSALLLQSTPYNPRARMGWRGKLRRLRQRAGRLVGKSAW
jgi:hypothetical protein